MMRACTWLLISLALWSTTFRALADSVQCPAPGLILIFDPIHPRLDPPTLRQLISKELGYNVYTMDAHPGCPTHGTLTIKASGDDRIGLHFSPADEKRESIKRLIKLPPPGDDPVPIVVALAGNLVRNQADELIPPKKTKTKSSYRNEELVLQPRRKLNYLTVAAGAEIGREPRLDGHQDLWAVPMVEVGSYLTEHLGPLHSGITGSAAMLEVFRLRLSADLYYEPVQDFECGVRLGFSIAAGASGKLPIVAHDSFGLNEPSPEPMDQRIHPAMDLDLGVRYWLTQSFGIAAFSRWIFIFSDGYTLGHQALPAGAVAWLINLSTIGRIPL